MDMEKELKTRTIPKLKIILLGDSGVGKTSLINQYVFQKFQSKPTLDFQDALHKDLELDGRHIMLQIQDTRGQERNGPGALELAFFNNAKGCMLVYDVNNPNSFDNLENWHNLFITRVISNTVGQKSLPFIVLGNKTDINGGKNKEVYHERARNWCESKGIYNMLTSAKDNKSVTGAFQYIAHLALDQEIENFHSNGNYIQGPHNPEQEPLSIPSNGLPTTTNSTNGPQKLPRKPMNQSLSDPSNGWHMTSFMNSPQTQSVSPNDTNPSLISNTPHNYPTNMPPYGPSPPTNSVCCSIQ